MKSDNSDQEPTEVEEAAVASKQAGDAVEAPKKSKQQDTQSFEDKVVDEIKHEEADELLKAKDDELAKAFEPETTRWQHFKRWLRDVWSEPKWRYSIIASTTLLLAALFVLPASRYFIFNTVGLRASATVQVTDDKTTQPVKNAVVTLAGQSGKTNADGEITLQHMKLGPTTLTVQKAAYSQVRQQITLGLGANKLGTKTLSAVGARLKFKVVDWLSKKPLPGAEAVLGDSSALADEEGLIELPVEADQEDAMEVSLQAERYTAKKVAASLADKNTKDVPLVVDYPEYFMSNRGGKFDLYRSTIEGANERVILASTGRETANGLELTIRGDRKYVALVSKRDNETNADGYQLETLTVIDSATDTAKKVTSSEDIYTVGWEGNRLIYVKIAAGASAANASRQRLMSYNLETGKDQELASSNYFVNALMLKGTVIYSPTDVYHGAKRGVFRIQVDGSSKQNIFDQDTWGFYRTDWDQISFQTNNNWYRFSLAKPTAEKLAQAISDPQSINYVDNNDHSQAAWFEQRDGKGTLLLRDTATKKDTVLKTQSGLQSVVGWAGDKHLVYRVVSPAETADYIISIDGGSAAKIKDVYNVAAGAPRY